MQAVKQNERPIASSRKELSLTITPNTGSICHYRHLLEMLPTLSEYIYASQHASCIKIPKLTSNTFFDTGQHVCKPCHKDCCVCLFKINIILAFDSRGSLKTKKYVPRQRKRLLSQNLVLIVGSLQNQIYLSMSLPMHQAANFPSIGIDQKIQKGSFFWDALQSINGAESSFSKQLTQVNTTHAI